MLSHYHNTLEKSGSLQNTALVFPAGSRMHHWAQGIPGGILPPNAKAQLLLLLQALIYQIQFPKLFLTAFSALSCSEK